MKEFAPFFMEKTTILILGTITHHSCSSIKQICKLIALPIIGILLLASCHTKVESDVHDTAKDRTKENVFELEYAAPCKVAGRFISSDKVDTLFFRHYSRKTHRYVDSIPILGDTYMPGDDIDWFRENDIVMKVTTVDGHVVHTENEAMSVHCAIPLSGVLPETDVLAVVWKHQDFSGIKYCHIISIKDGQWTELGSFTVNSNIFPDTLTGGMIDGFLEKRNRVWMYRDYDEQMQWAEDHDGECPMHPLKNILEINNDRTFSFQQNLDYLCYLGVSDYEWQLEHHTIDTAEVNSVTPLVRGMNLRMTPYKSVMEIKREFNNLYDMWLSRPWGSRSIWVDILRNRMQFHLSNPITFRQWHTTHDYDPFNVVISPDGKYKFYTTSDICEGTMGEWMTFYQYFDANGQLVCKQWQGDRFWPGNVIKVWQFDLNDTTFYVLKSRWQGSSCEWGYDMEIVSFDNGEPTYHIRFFPDMKEYSSVTKVLYENGEWIEVSAKEGGSYNICYNCRFLDVDYTFDPKTLTVIGTTQADTGAVKKNVKWKLNTEPK